MRSSVWHVFCNGECVKHGVAGRSAPRDASAHGLCSTTEVEEIVMFKSNKVHAAIITIALAGVSLTLQSKATADWPISVAREYRPTLNWCGMLDRALGACAWELFECLDPCDQDRSSCLTDCETQYSSDSLDCAGLDTDERWDCAWRAAYVYYACTEECAGEYDSCSETCGSEYDQCNDSTEWLRRACNR